MIKPHLIAILSTSHLPESDRDLLENNNDICTMRNESGYLLYLSVYNNEFYTKVLEPVIQSICSENLVQIIDWCRERGHNYLLFDRDGERHPELFKTFD